MKHIAKFIGWALARSIARFIGSSLATVVNFISDLLYLVSRPLWMRFGLWITSLQEKNNEEI